MSETDVSSGTSTTVDAALVVGAEPPGTADIGSMDRHVVAAFGDAERWLDAAYGPGTGGPDALICAGEMLRSATSADAPSDAEPGTITVSAVPEVGSLGRMAAELQSAIATATPGTESVGILLTGFDAAIDATSVETAFRFLHVLRGFMQAQGNETALYVYSTGSLGEDAVETLRPLFSSVTVQEA